MSQETAVCKWCKREKSQHIEGMSGLLGCYNNSASTTFDPSPAVPEAQIAPIPEDLRECYDACVAAQEAGCGEDSVDAETEIILIERIGRAEATIAQLKATVQGHNDSAVEAWQLTQKWQTRVFDLEAELNARATGKES